MCATSLVKTLDLLYGTCHPKWLSHNPWRSHNLMCAGSHMAAGQNSHRPPCCFDVSDWWEVGRGHFYALHIVGDSRPWCSRSCSFFPPMLDNDGNILCQMSISSIWTCCIIYTPCFQTVRHQIWRPVSYVNGLKKYIIPLVIVCILSNIIKSTHCSNVQLCKANAKENPNTLIPTSSWLIAYLVMIINTFPCRDLSCCASWQIVMTVITQLAHLS